VDGATTRTERDDLLRQVAGDVQALYRSATVIAARLAAASGLHPTDSRALELLDAAAGSDVTVGSLGAQLGLSSPAVTALVDRLERADLVERVRDVGDRRRVLVRLTDTARRYAAEWLEPVGRRIAAATADLSAAELATVSRFLRHLVDDGAA